MGQAEEGDPGRAGHAVGVERLAGEVDPAGEARMEFASTRVPSSCREVAIATLAPGWLSRIRISSRAA